MNTKKIPWWQPQVGTPKERELIARALDNNFINMGPMVRAFESELAALLGTRYAVMTSSCTAGLAMSLMTLGIGPGDEVLVPDLTFIATANAVSLAGAKPVLVDVDPATLTISLEAAEEAITAKTKIIIPVHVTGRGANMAGLLALAKKNHLHIIEDAAEALMSKQGDAFLGTFGTLGCFSFSPNKTITTGQGGLVVTDDAELVDKLHRLRDQGRPVIGTGGDDRHDTIGYNFRPTDLQAAVGLGQLTLLEERIARMKRNYELYSEQLQNIEGLSIFPSEPGEVPQWTDVLVEQRDDLEAYLRKENIDSRKYWLPLHRQLAYRMPDDNFPNSTKLSPQSLWLPSAFTLTDEDVFMVCDEIKTFFA